MTPQNARPRRLAWLELAFAATLMSIGSAARATDYNEAVSGDLSNDPLHPTSISLTGSLTLGDNYIVGSSIPSGDVIDTMTGERAVQDNDYVSFTVRPGQVLSQLIFTTGTSIQSGDRAFVGLAQGTQVNVAMPFTSAAGLLGYTLLGDAGVPPGTALVGNNVLPDIGRAAPTAFPPFGGATTFSGALGAGTYTLWLLDGDRPFVYNLNLVTTAVPEAATWMTMILGFGAVGLAVRRRRLGDAQGIRFA